MKRRIIETGDGSKTIQIDDWQEQYHSKHGAVQEAYHVFIKKGLDYLNSSTVNILEIGFGTGLNALITLIESQKRNLTILYTGIEKFPVTQNELEVLDYVSNLDAKKIEGAYQKMHEEKWDEEIRLAEKFTLIKQQKDFKDIKEDNLFNLIYFDAFGPRVQPELWTADIFRIMFDALKSEGVLVTYSAKGSVRRAMQQVGFFVERLEGPPGKREMLRATKPSNFVNQG